MTSLAPDEPYEALVLGSLAQDYLLVRPLRHPHPDAADLSDRLRVIALLEARAGHFTGRFEADLDRRDFERFRRDLERLHRELRGEARLDTAEGWLSVVVSGDGRGHLAAACELNDNLWRSTRLLFELTFDQTDVPPMLRALDAILGALPAG